MKPEVPDSSVTRSDYKAIEWPLYLSLRIFFDSICLKVNDGFYVSDQDVARYVLWWRYMEYRYGKDMQLTVETSNCSKGLDHFIK